MPSAFPALGHDVSTDYRTHPEDLSAQKLNLSAPNHHARAIGLLSSNRHSHVISTLANAATDTLTISQPIGSKCRSTFQSRQHDDRARARVTILGRQRPAHAV
jgi:hypothetical protein